MSLLTTSKGYAFTRNPIIIKEAFQDADFDANGGTVTITRAGDTVFRGRFFPPLVMDISEIIDAAADYFPEWIPDGSTPLYRLLDAMTLADRWRFCVEAEYDRIAHEASLIAVPGGVSKRTFKAYRDSDAFAHQFLNKAQNFFLTTRTTARRLILKETELAPLYFITDVSTRIDIVDAASGKALEFPELLPGLWALDPEALRSQFLDKFDVIPAVLEIHRDYIPAVTLVIEMALPSPRRHRLKFRNSLGVFEVVEVPGELSFSYADSDSDSGEFSRFDEDYFDFYLSRGPVKHRQSATLSTGVKRPDEILFVLDMAASDEVYLLDATPEPIRVIPSIEEPSYPERAESPQSLTVKLDFADIDSPVIPVPSVAGQNSNRIFSKQFSKQFN